MEKILIRRDTQTEARFNVGLREVISRGNELIDLYNKSQDFKRISTPEELEGLISDPVSFYDNTLTDNIAHDKGLQVNMSKLAELYNIPRADYLRGLGLPEDVIKTGCSSCSKAPGRIAPKTDTLSPREYTSYKEFIQLRGGALELNSRAVEDNRDSFNIYAESPEQIALYKRYESLTETLNEAIGYYKLSSVNIEDLAKMFHLLKLNNSLVLNDIYLSEQNKYLKR